MRLPHLLLLLLLLACGPLSACGGEDEPATTAPVETEATEPAKDDATELYFTTGEQFREVERDLPGDPADPEATAEALVEGPTPAEQDAKVEVQTAIPPETEVEDVRVDPDGTAVVEVSREFLAGVPELPRARNRAQEAELNARLGQVTFTMVELPGVEKTKVVADGEPVVPAGTPAAVNRADYAKPRGGVSPSTRGKGKDSSVREIQERLAELRYLPKRAVDGADGYRTRQAIIAFQSWRGLERDGVVGPLTSAALAKASPPKPKSKGPAKRIEVHREKGVALLIRNDKVKRAIHVSTGAPGTETPAGTFEVFRKEENSWSVPFQVWLPWASYFNAGIAFHSYPDVPTYPASHGCVRVPEPEAKGVYRFASIGTAVVVL